MTYTTKQGDTWDWIARRVYGSERKFPYLMQQNPQYMDVFIFDGGVKLNCPELPQTVSETAPAWRTLT